MNRATAALSWAFLLETWRTKPAIFWNLIFPVFTLTGFAYIFAAGDPVAVARVVPGIMTINLLAAAFFGVSTHMVNLREKELYRRFWATPLRPLTIVFAHAITGFISILVAAVLQLALAVTWFHVVIRGSLASLAAVIAVGAFAFLPMGLLVGSAARDTKVAPAISNLLFFPLSFLSGSAMPLYFMPAWLQRLATFLPATYLVESLQDVILRGDNLRDTALPITILLLTGIIAFAFNTWLFRWESRQPINKRGLALTVACLTVIYGTLFLHGIKLESSETPAGTGAAAEYRVSADTRILMGMTILDGAGNRQERGEIVIEGNRIVAVGPSEGIPPKGVPVTDLTGLYVIPGLIDSHIHLAGSGGGSVAAEEFAPSRVVRDTQVYLALGITSAVSLADPVEDMQKLKAEVALGTMRAPRVYISGPVITAPHGHPSEIFASTPGFAEYMTRQVNSPEAAAQAVRDLAGLRVDIVKLYLEGGWPGQSFPVLCEACVQSAIRTARELGLRTTVHVDNDLHARMAVEAGADGIEHIPPDLSDKTIQEMASKGITLTPTLSASEALSKLLSGNYVPGDLDRQWVLPEVLSSLESPQTFVDRTRQSKETVDYFVRRYDRSREALRRAVAGHVTILAGSDAGNSGMFHGPALLRELELLVQEGGISPGAALVAATGAGARRLGSRDIGRIAPGAFADMVVLEADPSRDIHALRKVRAVYFGGVQLQRDALLNKRPGSWSPLFSFPVPANDRSGLHSRTPQ